MAHKPQFLLRELLRGLQQKSANQKLINHKINLGLVQLDIAEGEWEINARRALNAAGRLAARGAEVIALPEMWTSFDPKRRAELAEFSEGALREFCRFSREAGVFLIFSQLERAAGESYNTAYVLSPAGKVSARYRKLHLFHRGGETAWFRPGKTLPPLIASPAGPFSLAICFDLRFPAIFSLLARRGARLLVIPAQWPAVRRDHWLSLLRARAIETQSFVAGVNRRGVKNGESYVGDSAVFGPWGERLLLLPGIRETGLLALDLAAVPRIRQDFPVHRFAHPEWD